MSLFTIPSASMMAVALFLALTIPAAGQSSDPLWLDELKGQISQKESCEVNYFLHVKEYKLGKDTVYEARVSCLDGREFDATRTGERSRFEWRACQPQVC